MKDLCRKLASFIVIISFPLAGFSSGLDSLRNVNPPVKNSLVNFSYDLGMDFLSGLDNKEGATGFHIATQKDATDNHDTSTLRITNKINRAVKLDKMVNQNFNYTDFFSIPLKR